MDRKPDRVLDEYLVALSQNGSRAALDQLAARWTPRVLRHASRLVGSGDLAMEAAQETWAAAIKGLNRLNDPARFPAWLFGIATRKCADSIRAAIKRRRIVEAIRVESEGELVAAQSGDAIDLRRAIAHLPAAQRAAISLFYGEDLELHEVATALGLPIGTVKSRLHHARATLKQHIEGENR